MIYLRTGLPGASKTLNSLRELVLSHDETRPFFYHNIKLLMLDFEVANSFSGWYYGWFFPRLKNKAQKRKLIKIMKPIHDNDEFITLSDVPWLEAQFNAHNHFDTWLYWVRRVYPKKTLERLELILDAAKEEGIQQLDLFEMVKPLNLHFTHFENPAAWMELPKGSVILIDEVQQFFPPRPAGSRIPAAIQALETHRHGGYDIHFVTQDASLSDQNLRKLVGRHIHFYNPFGGKRVTRFENPGTFQTGDYHAKKQAKKKSISHATNFYGVYWSAEIHTHKFQFPKFLLVGLFCILLLVGSIYYVVSLLTSKTQAAEPVPDSPTQQQTVPAQPPISSPPVRKHREPIEGPIRTVANPLSETYSENPSADRMDRVLISYLDDLMEDVYITGSIAQISQDSITYDYTFYRNTDDAVFHPLDVGLEVEPIGRCLANVRLGSLVRLVTCDPFYKRVPVEDKEEKESLLGPDAGQGTQLATNTPKESAFL